MDKDSVLYDSLAARPLPKWLTDQRDGLNTIQLEKMEMKEDNSLSVSFFLTGAIILIVVAFLTVLTLRKKNKSI